MIKVKLLIILFILSHAVSARSYLDTVDKEILDLTFNEKYEQALNLTQKQINKFGDTPKYYFYRLNTLVIEQPDKLSRSGTTNRDSLRTVLLEEIISEGESMVEKFEDREFSVENKFYYAGILGYLARLYGLNGSWWSAFQTGLDSKGLMEEIIEEDPTFYDAYLLLGMFEYYADRLSGITSFVASILGFSGDRQKAFEHLILAYEKGKITFGQASLTLIEIYARLEEYDEKAFPLFEKFIERYPGNMRTRNWYCMELINNFELDRAKELMDNTPRDQLDPYVAVLYNHRKNNRAETLEAIETYHNSFSPYKRWTRNYVKFIEAVHSLYLGDSDRVKSVEKELGESHLRAFEVIKNNPKESELIFDLTAKISLNDSLDSAKEMIAKNKSFTVPYLQHEFNYYAGIYYYKTNQFDLAEKMFANSALSSSIQTQRDSYVYLMRVYEKIDVSRQTIVNLIDKIDELDHDRLDYRAKDLAAKYNL